MTRFPDLHDFQQRFKGPLYLKLKQAIEGAIQDEHLRQGDALPPERDFSELSGVSRVTVRKAIDALVEEGLLVRRHGSGTFVAAPVERMEQTISRATSFSEDMTRRGMTAATRWLSRGLYLPNSDEVMTLGLSGDCKVARLKRLRLADETPIALERASLPDDVLPDPENVGTSLYAHLTARQARPVRAIQRISACVLTPKEAELLQVPEGSAALAVQRVAFLASGRVIETTRTLYRSDLYDLVAEQAIGPA